MCVCKLLRQQDLKIAAHKLQKKKDEKKGNSRTMSASYGNGKKKKKKLAEIRDLSSLTFLKSTSCTLTVKHTNVPNFSL